MRTHRPSLQLSGATLTLAALLASGLPGIGIAVSPLGAQSEPVTLRLEGRRGEAATYRFEQQIDLQMPREFGGDQEVGSRLVVEQRVERADDASIRYLAEVKDVSVEMAKAGAAGENLDFSRFEGQRFRLRLSRRGELEEIEPVGDTDLGAAQLQQSMRQVGFPVLPRGPVRAGDTWVDTTRVDAAAMALPADGEIVSVNHTTLKRLSRTDDGTVAELAVETSFRFVPTPGTMPGMEVAVTGGRTDDVRFDVGRGRFIDSEGSQRFEMTMAIPGATGALSIQGVARSQAALLPSE